MRLIGLIIIIITSFLYSCGKNEEVYKPAKMQDPYVTYKEGMNAFEKREFFFAEKKFSQAELGFNNVELAAKSAIMSSFSFYAINFYDRALNSLDRFIRTYPADKNIIYAKYLKAIIYFEQISDERKDIEPLIKADKEIENFIKEFPESDYAIDLKFKKELINNQLAAKELYVARYYISVKKWAAAIKRLKNIVQYYDNTVFVEEALHRLVEVYYYLGVEEEAKNYAKILGYNYNSSEWYSQSYKILNKDYKIPKKEKLDKDENFLKRMIKKII